MTGCKVLLRKLVLGLTVVSIWLICLTPPLQAAMINAVVRDDDNNLRAWGGENYREAPVLEILNRGDHVRVLEKRGPWVYVFTPEGYYGWINAGCLRAAPDIGWLRDMPPGLKERLGQFLEGLRAAAQSRNLQQLARLFAPGGLIIQARRFKDAGLDPSQQRPQVVPLYYASDVSVTMGTAWQLLISGARPPAAEAFWDQASHSFKVGAGKGPAHAALEKEEPLLPTHLAALRLAPEVRYVRGFSADLEGFPGPYPYNDPRRTPFSWVLQVSPERYLLMQFNRVGLYLIITDRPGEGLLLRAIFTQAP